MTCRHLLLLAALLAGCADDVPVVSLTGTATMQIALTVPDDPFPEALATYRWEVTAVPLGVELHSPVTTTSTANVIPPLRGVYVVDRWLVSGISERLTHHLVLTALGIAPLAEIDGSSSAKLGEPAPIHGTGSTSAEHLPLTYRWRLASRPAGSAATVTSASTPEPQLVPDVAGDYTLQLHVFDGELWSEPAEATIHAAQF